MMQVKVKIRPNETLPFPGICVHCTQPAVEKMEVSRRIGRVTRFVDVPLCADCSRELHRLSGAEERLRTIGRLAAAGGLLLTLAVTLLLTPAGIPFLLRLVLALLAGLVAAEGIYLLIHRSERRMEKLEKGAIRRAVSIENFSWRATTFNFLNEKFAAQFKELNEPYLMEL